MIKHTFPDKLGILKASKNNCNSLKALIVGNHPPFIKGERGEGYDLPKIESLEGDQIFC